MLIVTLGIFLISCSQKSQIQEYNKPALYWYNKMIDQLSYGYLENADDTYISLESEHGNSPLLPTALIILANAHMDKEQYQLANYYLDEYIKRFALSKNIDYVRYLKIKADFMGFAYEFRNQQLIENTIKNIQEYKAQFPNSAYIPLVDTMSARLFMAKASLDEEISKLYQRVDKPEGAKYYKEKAKKSWANSKNLEEIHVPFYRSIFEKFLH